MTGWHRKGRETSLEAVESEIRVIELCRRLAKGFWTHDEALPMVEAACQVDPYRTYFALTADAAPILPYFKPEALLAVLARHGIVIESDQDPIEYDASAQAPRPETD